MKKSEPGHRIALWIPGWYELDQTLVLDECREYSFYRDLPKEIAASHANVDWVFFNQVADPAKCEVRYVTIVEMHHEILGALLRIDTEGLDYIFFPADGEEMVVNAEENPGNAQGNIAVDDWTVVVTLRENESLPNERQA